MSLPVPSVKKPVAHASLLKKMVVLKTEAGLSPSVGHFALHLSSVGGERRSGCGCGRYRRFRIKRTLDGCVLLQAGGADRKKESRSLYGEIAWNVEEASVSSPMH